MEAGDQPAIETEDLSKSFGGTPAVIDLNLTVDSGTIYGFLGPNGAGKTTTMRMLTTITRPSGGQAWVAGHPIDHRRAVTRCIGYLPEQPPLYDELTGREQLKFVAGLRETDPEKADEQIERWLFRFSLLEQADNRIEGYSKGMRQKLGVIQAILHDPEVLFLDEPTAGLDPRAARTMRDTIQELANRDVTVFLSTHILPVVEELADRVGVIHEGALVEEGSPRELSERVGSSPGTDLEAVFLALTSESTRRPSMDAEATQSNV